LGRTCCLSETDLESKKQRYNGIDKVTHSLFFKMNLDHCNNTVTGIDMMAFGKIPHSTLMEELFLEG
jgi:hypothetical protein